MLELGLRSADELLLESSRFGDWTSPDDERWWI